MTMTNITYLSLGSGILIAGAFIYSWYTSKLVKPPKPTRLPKDDHEKETWFLHISNNKKDLVRQKIEAAGMSISELNIGNVMFYIVETNYDTIIPYYETDGVRSIGRNQAISVGN